MAQATKPAKIFELAHMLGYDVGTELASQDKVNRLTTVIDGGQFETEVLLSDFYRLTQLKVLTQIKLDTLDRIVELGYRLTELEQLSDLQRVVVWDQLNAVVPVLGLKRGAKDLEGFGAALFGRYFVRGLELLSELTDLKAISQVYQTLNDDLVSGRFKTTPEIQTLLRLATPFPFEKAKLEDVMTYIQVKDRHRTVSESDLVGFLDLLSNNVDHDMVMDAFELAVLIVIKFNDSQPIPGRPYSRALIEIAQKDLKLAPGPLSSFATMLSQASLTDFEYFAQQIPPNAPMIFNEVRLDPLRHLLYRIAMTDRISGIIQQQWTRQLEATELELQHLNAPGTLTEMSSYLRRDRLKALASAYKKAITHPQAYISAYNSGWRTKPRHPQWQLPVTSYPKNLCRPLFRSVNPS